VSNAVKIMPRQDVLAAAGTLSTFSLRQDLPVDDPDLCAFASVNNIGDVVFIAGQISHDSLTREFPGNPIWIAQTIRTLQAESAQDQERFDYARRWKRFIALARGRAKGLTGDAAGEAYAQELDQALASELRAALRRESVGRARAQLKAALGDSFDRLEGDSADFLVEAEVFRLDLEGYASYDPGQDFALAIHGFSKALEAELLAKLFMPLRDHRPPVELPAPTGDEFKDRSVEILRRFIDAGKISLGQMATCLSIVGRSMATVPNNAFPSYLDSLLTDRPGLLERDRFAQRLEDYARTYRNDAAHASRLSLDQCRGARSVLLEEPTFLLGRLLNALK
jgi:hypothetical protein